MEDPLDAVAPYDAVASLIDAAVCYGRSSERLVAAINSLEGPINALAALVDLDADLQPEVNAALDHLRAALDTLGRAGQFTDARYAAALARIRADVGIPPKKGDPQ